VIGIKQAMLTGKATDNRTS